MAYGFVYVATNESMPGLVKIGATEKSPSFRVKQLSQATGVPTPFELYCAFEFEDVFSAEADIHKQFDECRTTQCREFFDAHPLDVYQFVCECIGCFLTEITTVELAFDQYKRQEKCQTE